ncbi:glyoxalase [Parasphingorhabdus flavimaris]|uniref:Glyoxalase n=1 Tax=Parasphingorhabdus flavimaris TaxID=266812 RepID=A0ABX2MZY1_9SPHN|nr:glyoxalase [Parasphingorhabdus flavimaris]NVD27015.1 glyoxalase [Parasphingorhabdus flavimaris]
MQVLALDHVQLAMPAGEEASARAFYAGILGIPETPKPPNLAKRGGCWFERGLLKAHPALLVQGLRELIVKLEHAGFSPQSDEPLEGYDRVYVADPFGNRIELMEPLAVG